MSSPVALLIAGSLLLSPSAHALDLTVHRILGAKKVDVLNSPLAPWVPKLVTIAGSGQTSIGIGACTGTFIGENVVLTAAHCVLAVKGQKLKQPVFKANGEVASAEAPIIMAAVAGAGGKANMFYATEIAIHPTYKIREGYFNGDIALIKFRETLAQPIARGAKLVLDNVGLGTPGATVQAIGYGTSNITGGGWFGGEEKRSSDGLRQKTLEIFTSIDPDFTVYQSDALVMKAREGDEPGNVCHGDSGGPILRQVSGRYVIVGVNSRSERSCTGTASAVKTINYKSWIAGQVAKWGLTLYN